MKVEELYEDEAVELNRFSISAYGSDTDVSGYIERLESGKIIVPDFQREYVWNISQASKLVESVILGLPIPSIFFMTIPEKEKIRIIVDGQQRLLSLAYFKKGFFPGRTYKENEDLTTIREQSRVFRLVNVTSELEGKTYDTLDGDDRNAFDDAIIHSITIKQERPDDNSDSMFYVFERLNTGGLKLSPQEIRSAIYPGNIHSLIELCVTDENWNDLVGSKDSRQRDSELVLRFLAFMFTSGYKKPLKTFLNLFMKKKRNLDDKEFNQYLDIFKTTSSIINNSIGKNAFRKPGSSSINAALCDALMIGVARNVIKGSSPDLSVLHSNYNVLLDNDVFISSIEKSTSDENQVNKRQEMASQAFKPAF